MADYTVAKIDEIEGYLRGRSSSAPAQRSVSSSFGMQVMDLPPDSDALPRARSRLRRPGGGLRDPTRRRRDRDRRRASPA